MPCPSLKEKMSANASLATPNSVHLQRIAGAKSYTVATHHCFLGGS
ncbi:hypothetical protein NC651_038553 [Populus alba x Populus x berolinensis]|nr:hypothetical protein NC651_038553 [Populus alba x Populus x berolinensis]